MCACVCVCAALCLATLVTKKALETTVSCDTKAGICFAAVPARKPFVLRVSQQLLLSRATYVRVT